MSSTPRRDVSRDIASQRDQTGVDTDTCWAHSASRVILRTFKMTDDINYPVLGSPGSAQCNSLYNNTYPVELGRTYTRDMCTIEETNNLIMYFFLYYILTKKYGFNAAYHWYPYMVNLINGRGEDPGKTNLSTYITEFVDLNRGTAFGTVCELVLPRLCFAVSRITLNYESISLTVRSNPDKIIDALQAGYYFSIIGPTSSSMNHVMTVVGYTRSPLSFIIKDSYGVVSRHPYSFGPDYSDGVTMTGRIADLIRTSWTTIQGVLITGFDQVATTSVKAQLEQLSLVPSQDRVSAVATSNQRASHFDLEQRVF
jgi:hypothetical protein